MSSAGKYQLNKIKQLIDLNGDKVNFELNFFVKSTNNAPFEAIVLDQETLNSEQPIEYKNVDTGELTGNIVWNKNIYKNYLLVLRSKDPCECEVTIDIQDIEPEEPQVVPPEIVRPRQQAQVPPAPVRESVQKPQRKKKEDDESSSGGIFKTILIVIAVIFAAYIGYWVYTNYFANKNGAAAPASQAQQVQVPQLQLPTPQLQLPAPQVQLPTPQVAPQVAPQIAPHVAPVSDIVNRINNLSM
jgi:hypothetical protein